MRNEVKLKRPGPNTRLLLRGAERVISELAAVQFTGLMLLGKIFLIKRLARFGDERRMIFREVVNDGLGKTLRFFGRSS